MDADPELIRAVMNRSRVMWSDGGFSRYGYAHLYGLGPQGEPQMLVWRTIHGPMDQPKPCWALLRRSTGLPVPASDGTQDEIRVLTEAETHTFRTIWR